MNWTELDWATLDRLRDNFLGGGAAQGPYWRSAADLAHYDLTFGERIGWKWDAVLRELRLRGWTPTPENAAPSSVVDWGCGSGVAGRRAISFFGADQFTELLVWDHSPLAADFAAEAATRAFLRLKVTQATPGFLQSDEPIGLLLVSHVLNELSTESLSLVRAMLLRSRAVIWVEPGTHEVSRGLGTIRDSIQTDFNVIAPCTHQNACPMFTPGRERDWCHFFAPPPSEIFGDPNWVKFGQRAGIDLRSLPYAFIALERKRAGSSSVSSTEDLSRMIGRPEHFKPYARLLNCDANGLADLEVLKRSAPALYKELDRTKTPLVCRWQREGNKIVGGEILK